MISAKPGGKNGRYRVAGREVLALWRKGYDRKLHANWDLSSFLVTSRTIFSVSVMVRRYEE